MRPTLLATLLLASTPALAGSVKGRFVPAQPADHMDAVTAKAVEEGLQQMAWGFRPFARPKLKKTTEWCKGIDVSLTDTQFHVQCDDRTPFSRAVADTSGTFTGDDGKEYQLDFQVSGSKVSMRFSGEDGGKAIVYDFRPDGTMKVEYEIFSSYLKNPMTWALEYKKAK